MDVKAVIDYDYSIILDIRKFLCIDVNYIDKQFHSSNDYNIMVRYFI